MALKVKNQDVKVLKGKTPIRAVMLGNTCIYGENLKMYTVDYPATPIGAGFYIDINGKRMVSNPSESGRLGVVDGTNVVVRTYGLKDYMNPISAVVCGDGEIVGESVSIKLSEEVSIERATIYSFVANANIVLNINEAEVAPKVRIPIIKDEGVASVNWIYYQSPYRQVFSANTGFTVNATESYLGSDDYFDICVGSKIVKLNSRANYYEGYKADTIEASYYGYITYDNQSTINVTSKKGKTIVLFCPALPEGVESYSVNMISSEYSRVCPANSNIHIGDSQSNTLSTRVVNNKSYYFYEEDVIEIKAERKQGYKKPTLGKEDDITELVSSKSITLSDNTALIVRSGEKGIPIELENNPLPSGEFALLNVVSEYQNSLYGKRYPTIYVGDTVTIPLNCHNRVGTAINRKPGVGLSNGTQVIRDITFNSDIEYKVTSADLKLIILLEKGAERITTIEFSGKDELLRIDDEGTNKCTSAYDRPDGIYSSIKPVADLGSESYFIKSLRLVFYTKRYLGDVFSDKFIKHDYQEITSPFEYSCTSSLGVTYNRVLTGSYTISEDKKNVSLTIKNYNRNWVANSKKQVYLYAHEIII